MDNLVPIFVVGIIALTTYRIIELFVRRKERMIILDKLQNGIDPAAFSHQLKLPLIKVPRTDSWPIRLGLLMIGIGIGLIVGFLLEASLTDSIRPEFGHLEHQVQRNIRDTVGLIYFACVSLFGGAGLLTAYFVEQKTNKDKS
jgi:hypothetical protein